MSPTKPPDDAAPADTGFDRLVPGTVVGPLRLAVSRAANERYWSSAGVDHASLHAGALYPPIAANLPVLAVQTVVDQPLLQTAQRVVCHRRAHADVELTVTGRVTDRVAKRGRDYVVVTAEVTLPDGDPLWTSVATFCAAGS
jgi:hypothetical protein